jgi:hypothetical protein
MFTRALGIVVEVKRMSAQDRLARKKYMGVWRCVSAPKARKMRGLPATVMVYIHRNSRERCTAALVALTVPRGGTQICCSNSLQP